MVSDPATEDIVCWDETGDSFIVLKEFEFASQLLPIYFRHKNFSSFVRQLNFYGFHKRNHEGKFTKFYHPFFKRNQLALLKQIKRKSTESSSNIKETVSALASQVRDLKSQYDDLLKIQRQILFMFGSYMRNSGNNTQGINRIQPKKQRLMIEPTQQVRQRQGNQSQFSHSQPSAHPSQQVNTNAQVELLDDEEDYNGEDSPQHSEQSEFDEDFDGEFQVEDPERDEAVRKAREEAWSELNALQDLLNQFPSRDAFLQPDEVKQFNQRNESRQVNRPIPRPEPIQMFAANSSDSVPPLSPLHNSTYPTTVPASALSDSISTQPLDPPKLLYGSEHYEKEEQKRVKTETPDSRSIRKRKNDDGLFFSPTSSSNQSFSLPLYEFQPPISPTAGFSSSFSPVPQRTMSSVNEPLMAPPILYAQSSGEIFPSPDPDPPMSMLDYSIPTSPAIVPSSPSMYFSNSLNAGYSDFQQPQFRNL
jgi:hypothetical protein